MPDLCERNLKSEGRFHLKFLKAKALTLKILVDALEGYDEQSETDFADIIDYVIQCRFNPTELAGEFKVSVSTVSRWRAGKSCPPAYARKVIVHRIREMLVLNLSHNRRISLETID